MQRLLIPGLFFCVVTAPAPSIGAPARDLSQASASDALTVSGTVTGSESRWSESGDRIVTDSVIELAGGGTVTVRQIGGTVGEIGMKQFPSPPILRLGDRVEARVSPAVTGGRRHLLDVTSLVRAQPAPGLAPLSGGKPGDTRSASEPVQLEYVRTMTDGGAPLHWGSGCTYIVFDSAGTTHLPGEMEFEIMEQALQHWRDSTASCSYMDFVVEEPRPMEVGYDGFNVVKFRERTWCRPEVNGEPEACYAYDAAGLTTVTFIDNPKSKRYGEILDADVELNGTERFAISANGETLAPEGRDLSDLSNTFTHEVGHFLGLDHACRVPSEPPRLDHEGNEVPLCAGELLEATMHPTQDSGETKKATLEQDDIQGACEIHPLLDDPGRCEPVDLTPSRRYCTVSPAGTPSGTAGGPVAFAALLLCTLFLLRRRNTARR